MEAQVFAWVCQEAEAVLGGGKAWKRGEKRRVEALLEVAQEAISKRAKKEGEEEEKKEEKKEGQSLCPRCDATSKSHRKCARLPSGALSVSPSLLTWFSDFDAFWFWRERCHGAVVMLHGWCCFHIRV